MKFKFGCFTQRNYLDRAKQIPLMSKAKRNHWSCLAQPINWLSGLSSLLVALSGSYALPVSAAQQLNLRIGPMQSSISINEIETFAQTGEISPSLKLYRLLLTPQVQQLLNRKLRIEPRVVDRFVDELLKSSDGERLVEHLRLALPKTTIEQLQVALSNSLQTTDGFSAISFLQAYPGESLTIDSTAAVRVFVQLNAAYLQSQVLNPLLEKELFVAGEFDLPSNLDPTVTGKAKVRWQTLPLYDRQRDRKIVVDLYYSKKPHGPLVIMSHGFAADRKFLRYLAKHLASHGLSVASIEHPGSNIESLSDMALSINPGNFLSSSEFIERPEDVSFVLDEIERLGKHWQNLAAKFNTNQVTILGHSLGGYTALALAGGELNLVELRAYCQNHSPLGRSPADWLQCAAADLPQSKLKLQDQRIVQVIALNPVVGKLFGNQGLNQVKVPTMVLSGTNDTVTPPLHHHLRPFSQIKQEKYLLAAVGGTHMSVTDLANVNSSVGQSTMVREVMGDEAQPIRQTLRGVSLAFIKQLTPEATDYKQFLTPHYIQSFSPLPTDDQKQAVQLRLATQTPIKVNRWLQVLAFSNQQGVTQDAYQQQSLLSKTNLSTFTSRFLGSRRTLQAEYCTGRLNSYFDERLGNYRQQFRKIKKLAKKV